MASEHSRDGASSNAEFGGDPVRAAALSAAQLDDAVLDVPVGSLRAGARSRRPNTQSGFTFGGVSVDPLADAFSGDAHGFGDMGLRTAGAVPLDDEQSAADGSACIAVGNRNLRVDVASEGTSRTDRAFRNDRRAVKSSCCRGVWRGACRDQQALIVESQSRQNASALQMRKDRRSLVSTSHPSDPGVGAQSHGLRKCTQL